MTTGHLHQPASEPIPFTERISVHEATASDLHTVNGIITESIVSWGLPDRVRRLATPSLTYNESDLKHMSVIFLINADGSGIAMAAWEEASGLDVPENTKEFLIHGLYVVPACQQRGLGTRLIELVANRISHRKSGGMTVRAWRDSVAFFLSRGFAPIKPDSSTDTYPQRLWRSLR